MLSCFLAGQFFLFDSAGDHRGHALKTQNLTKYVCLISCEKKVMTLKIRQKQLKSNISVRYVNLLASESWISTCSIGRFFIISSKNILYQVRQKVNHSLRQCFYINAFYLTFTSTSCPNRFYLQRGSKPSTFWFVDDLLIPLSHSSLVCFRHQWSTFVPSVCFQSHVRVTV